MDLPIVGPNGKEFNVPLLTDVKQEPTLWDSQAQIRIDILWKLRKAMTVMLKLKPEVEAGLLRQAQDRGMTLEEYLLSLVEGTVLSKAQEDLSADERAAAFEAWSAGHRPTPLLSDYAVSREGIYEGRDD